MDILGSRALLDPETRPFHRRGAGEVHCGHPHGGRRPAVNQLPRSLVTPGFQVAEAAVRGLPPTLSAPGRGW